MLDLMLVGYLLTQQVCVASEPGCRELPSVMIGGKAACHLEVGIRTELAQSVKPEELGLKAGDFVTMRFSCEPLFGPSSA